MLKDIEHELKAQGVDADQVMNLAEIVLRIVERLIRSRGLKVADYERACERVSSYPHKGEGSSYSVACLAEVGEIFGAVADANAGRMDPLMLWHLTRCESALRGLGEHKRAMRTGQARIDPLSVSLEVSGELGDLAYGLARVAADSGRGLEQVLQDNMAKLMSRGEPWDYGHVSPSDRTLEWIVVGDE